MIKIFLISALLILTQSCMKTKSMKKELLFTLRFSPTSLDPIKFDKLENQIVTSSINSPLVSNLGSHGFSPKIAKTWRNEENFKKWVVTVDTSRKYSNGEEVKVSDVLLNFQRYLFLSKMTKSKNEFLEHLVGYENLEINKLKNIAELEIEGLKIDKNNIVFTFNKSIENFLDKISFGIYAIAHPTSFDEKGNWIESKTLITTGDYKVEQWGSNEVILKSIIEKPLKIDKVRFIIGFTKENLLKSDMAYASKYSLAFEEKWKFLSRTKDTNIVYVQVMRWNNKGDFWADKENRKLFRNEYYKYLEENGLELSNSFFPSHIKGIKKIQRQETRFTTSLKEIKVPPFFDPIKSNSNQMKKDLGEIYRDSLAALCLNNKIKLNYENYPEKEIDEKKIFDFQFLGTGINIEDPYDDIRFMFLSKEGIRLPYESKEIEVELKKEKFDVQKINQILFDEAIVWPIITTSQGIWVNSSNTFNYSNLNLTKIAIDFSMVEIIND